VLVLVAAAEIGQRDFEVSQSLCLHTHHHNSLKACTWHKKASNAHMCANITLFLTDHAVG